MKQTLKAFFMLAIGLLTSISSMADDGNTNENPQNNGHKSSQVNITVRECPYLTNVSVNLTWDVSMVARANAHLSISEPDGTRPAYKLNGGYFTIIPLSSHRFSATVPIQYYVFTYDGNYVDSIRYNGSLLIDYECDNDMFFYASPINPNTSNN